MPRGSALSIADAVVRCHGKAYAAHPRGPSRDELLGGKRCGAQHGGVVASSSVLLYFAEE
ncbi:hypothetical protein ABTW96_25595 [Nocardia beijingensis]